MRWLKKKQPPEAKTAQFERLLATMIAAKQGIQGEIVSPDSALSAPTVQAIDTAISRRMSVTPLHVYRKSTKNGHDVKERLADHPVSMLLRKPNEWQTSSDFWLDASSVWTRHGNFYAYKSQDGNGKIHSLIPLQPPDVEPKLTDNTTFNYLVTEGGRQVPYASNKILHARNRATNFYEGKSPVKDIQTAIMMEILAEKFGETFFRNGAVPMQVFKYMDGFKPFSSAEEEKQFVKDFKEAFSGGNKFNAMLLPHGIDASSGVAIENDKAQFIESRKYQRTVIAGAFGVPPHLVGDLSAGTYSNVEQQDKDFTMNCVLPVAKSFESALERDLLTDVDRNSGVVIRFNLNAILRADFKSRQEGLWIQRQGGALSANEWREIEGMNPREGGDTYYDQGPSGQGSENAEA